MTHFKSAPRHRFFKALWGPKHEACLQGPPRTSFPVPCMTFEGVIRAVREGRWPIWAMLAGRELYLRARRGTSPAFGRKGGLRIIGSILCGYASA